MRRTLAPSDENRLLAILFMTVGFVFFDRLALSFLFPFMSAELKLTHAQLGMASSVLSLTWALSGTLAGAWSDAHSRRKSLLVAAVLGFSFFSAASGLIGGFAGLLAFRALMGIAEGPVLPISQSLMIDSSSPARRGLNMGLLQGSSAGLLGAMIGPPVVVHIAMTYGWRQAFYLSCIPGVLIAAAIWRWVRESPRDDQAVAKPAARIRYRTLLLHRNVMLCALISCLFVTWFVVIVSFAPSFLIETKHYTAAQMSLVMSCLGAAWVIWGFAVPALSDRIGRKPAMVIFALISACCPVAFMHVASPLALGLLMLATYTGLGCFTLFMSTIPAETVPPAAMASTLGLIMGVGELIGGFIAPTAAGFAADRYGLFVTMWIAAGGALLAGVASMFLIETAPAALARRRQVLTQFVQRSDA